MPTARYPDRKAVLPDSHQRVSSVSARADQFLQRLGHAGAEGGDQRAQQRTTLSAARFTVGGDGALIHRSGGLDLGMSVHGEQRGQSGFLFVGVTWSQFCARSIRCTRGEVQVPARFDRNFRRPVAKGNRLVPKGKQCGAAGIIVGAGQRSNHPALNLVIDWAQMAPANVLFCARCRPSPLEFPVIRNGRLAGHNAHALRTTHVRCIVRSAGTANPNRCLESEGRSNEQSA